MVESLGVQSRTLAYGHFGVELSTCRIDAVVPSLSLRRSLRSKDLIRTNWIHCSGESPPSSLLYMSGSGKKRSKLWGMRERGNASKETLNGRKETGEGGEVVAVELLAEHPLDTLDDTSLVLVGHGGNRVADGVGASVLDEAGDGGLALLEGDGDGGIVLKVEVASDSLGDDVQARLATESGVGDGEALEGVLLGETATETVVEVPRRWESEVSDLLAERVCVDGNSLATLGPDERVANGALGLHARRAVCNEESKSAAGPR